MLFVILCIDNFFPFGVVIGKRKLIAPVPDHCLSFYLATRSYGINTYHRFYNINFFQSMNFQNPKYCTFAGLLNVGSVNGYWYFTERNGMERNGTYGISRIENSIFFKESNKFYYSV